MRTWRRIRAVAIKETLHIRRDRLTFSMIGLMPVLMLMLFGYAINQDVRHLSAGVVDHANTSLSRALVLASEATQVIDIEYRVDSPEDLETLLRQGHISVGIFIPGDFEQRVARGNRAPAHLLVDAGDPLILAAAREVIRTPIESHPVPRSIFEQPPKSYELKAYYNPERRTAVHIVPGVFGVILTMTMTLLAGVSIVRERERGNFEFLIATPVRPIELMVGKMLPYILIGLFQVGLIIVLSVVLFQLPIRGSIIQLYAGAFCFILSALALGLAISTVVRSQFQTIQVTMFVLLPSILLAGFMFPYDGMPEWAQILGEGLPKTHLLRIVRGIMLRGASLGELINEVYALGAIFLVCFSFAVLRFRKNLD